MLSDHNHVFSWPYHNMTCAVVGSPNLITQCHHWDLTWQTKMLLSSPEIALKVIRELQVAIGVSWLFLYWEPYIERAQ